MTTWNNRIIKEGVDDNVNYQIHEVFYDAKGRIEGWTAEPVGAFGESFHELRDDVMHLWSAFRLPILEKKLDELGKEILVKTDDVSPAEFNEWHYFEIMDRASVAMAHFDDFVGSHPVVRKEKELTELAQVITDGMYELYRRLSELAIPTK